VLTTDLLTDHVDFELAEVDPAASGARPWAPASALAAMAAGRSRLVSLALRGPEAWNWPWPCTRDSCPAERYNVAIAGGDTNSWDGPLVISVTLLGEVTPPGPLCRAAPGRRIGSWSPGVRRSISAPPDFEPRVEEALLLAERYRLRAGIDASDGLSIDLAHLAEESAAGDVDLKLVPIAQDAHRLAVKLATALPRWITRWRWRRLRARARGPAGGASGCWPNSRLESPHADRPFVPEPACGKPTTAAHASP